MSKDNSLYGAILMFRTTDFQAVLISRYPVDMFWLKINY